MSELVNKPTDWQSFVSEALSILVENVSVLIRDLPEGAGKVRFSQLFKTNPFASSHLKPTFTVYRACGCMSLVTPLSHERETTKDKQVDDYLLSPTCFCTLPFLSSEQKIS